MAEISDALAAEFDSMMVRAGLAISPANRAAMLPGYAELRAQVELLRGLPATAEPANTFRLHALTGV